MHEFLGIAADIASVVAAVVAITASIALAFQARPDRKKGGRSRRELTDTAVHRIGSHRHLGGRRGIVIAHKRIMVTSGVITRQVAMLPLLRVTDMKYEQSALGRPLDYGSFKIESAGR